jgi:nucleotide-binding universal stress UspA family protein
MKLLFCTDGSEISFNALKNCRRWIGDEGEVDIISVIDLDFLPDEVNLKAPGFYEFCTNSALETLEKARGEAERLGFSAGKLIKHCGPVSESILEELKFPPGKGVGYDLVVLGSHGKKGIRNWLGSVSHAVVSHSETCAYVAKHENAGKKALFTTDGSFNSIEGTMEAVSRLNLAGKEIYICMVNEEPGLLFLEGTLDTNWLLSLEQEQKTHAQQAINRISEIITEKGFEVEEKAVLIGDPAKEILEYVKDRGIDLIVMSCKEHKNAFLKGAVSKRVMEYTRADVLVAKRQQ